MEKWKILTIPLPIQECYGRLPYLIEKLGWQTIRKDPETHFITWRKGHNWILQRQEDLTISLVELRGKLTKVILIIRGKNNLITPDLAMVVDQIQTTLV